jgi:drug/metabolite transporter (DMT)-like permease
MLLHAHSGFRYLVLLMALVVILYAAYGIATKREYDRQMRTLSALLTAALDLTVLLGFATIFAGTFYPQLGGHIVMMVLATAVAHVVHGVMKRRPDDQRSFAPHLVGTAIVLGMVVAGIMAIGRPVVG